MMDRESFIKAVLPIIQADTLAWDGTSEAEQRAYASVLYELYLDIGEEDCDEDALAEIYATEKRYWDN